MEFIKTYSRLTFILLIVSLSLLIVLFNAVIYFGMDYLLIHPDLMNHELLNHELTDSLLLNSGQLPSGEDVIRFLQANIKYYFFPGTIIIIVFSALVIWLFLKSSLVKAIEKSGVLENNKKNVKKTPVVDKKAKEESDRRMFLHLFSVFQREGRLVDFFAEDLTLYEDDQIGAAVRSIQESCKKSMNKYLSPRPVMEIEEGEDVTIEAGFDPGAVKLTGNVTGEPPFKGVVRHKGWKVSNYELPKLGGKQDSTIISPAEVEITEV